MHLVGWSERSKNIDSYNILYCLIIYYSYPLGQSAADFAHLTRVFTLGF